MKRLLLIPFLCSLGWASTPTVTLKAVAAATGVTVVNTASQTTTTGQTNVAICFSNSTSTTLSASDGTNTFTAVGTTNTTLTGEGSGRVFVAKNITGVAHAISCNSTVSGFVSIFFYECAGASTTSPVDVPTTTSGANGTSATPSFTLPTTTFANDILIFGSSCANTCSAGSGVDSGNSQSDGNGDESETYSKTATGTYTGAFAQTSGTFIVVGVAITDGNSGGPTCHNSLALMGVGCR